MSDMHAARERMRLTPDEIRELTDLFYGKANHPPFLAAVEKVAARVAHEADPDDDRIVAWYRVARHPFMKSAYETRGTFIDAVIDLLDRATIVEPAKTHKVGDTIEGDDYQALPVRAVVANGTDTLMKVQDGGSGDIYWLDERGERYDPRALRHGRTLVYLPEVTK